MKKPSLSMLRFRQSLRLQAVVRLLNELLKTGSSWFPDESLYEKFFDLSIPWTEILSIVSKERKSPK